MKKLPYMAMAGLLALAALLPRCEQKSDPQESLTLDADLLKGRKLYAKHGCVSCHGPLGAGDGPVGRALDPPPRNFRKAGNYAQGNTAPEIARTIQTGIPNTMMVAYPLSEEDRLLIARFIVYLQNN